MFNNGTKMRLIKRIEYIDVPDNPWPIQHHPEMTVEAYDLNGHPADETFEIVREMVRGRHFHMRDGTDLIVGFSGEAEKAIGLTYDDFQKMQEDAENLQKAYDALDRHHDRTVSELNCIQGALSDINNEGFWKSLKRFLTCDLFPRRG